MALVENSLSIANTDAVIRFPYVEGETTITTAGIKLTDLPGDPSIIIGPRVS
jgi:hypothetical protein